MSRRFRTVLAALAVPAVAVTACGGDSDDPTAAAAGAGGETVTVTDSRGEQEVPLDPERVVVFDLASLDTMDALGVDAATGVPQQIPLPSYLEQYGSDDYVNVGDLFEPDLESLPEADPDLIIIGGRSSGMYDTLAGALDEVPILDLSVDETDYLASVEQNIETIGTVFGKEAEAADAIARLDDRIAAIREQTADAGTALALLTTGGEVTAYSVNSRYDFLFSEFGFQAATEELGDTENRHGESVSFEFIRDANPDRLFVVDRDAAKGEEGKTAQEILDNPLVEATPAAANGDITYVDPMAWYIVPGGLTGFGQIIDDVEANLS